MIIKGQAFTFMYETRNKNTGALVPDASATHTITVFYQGSSGWTSEIITANNGQNGKSPVAYNASSPAFPAYVGSTDAGLYLCQISGSYTDCEHVIVSIESSNTDVIVPVQQFYPVNMSQFATPQSVWNYGNNDLPITTRTLTTSDNIARAVWEYGDVQNGSRTKYRTLADTTANINSSNAAIANAVWGRQNGSDRTLTSDTLDNNSSISASVWTYGDNTINSSNHTRTVHRKLTTNELEDAKQTPDKLALDGDFNVTIDGEGLEIDIDANAIATQVWSHSGRSLDSLTVTTTTNGSTTQRTLATTYDLGSLQDHGDATWGGTTINMDNSGDPVAIDSNAIASAVLEGIPSAVWNMTIEGNTPYSRMERIADYVWGRNPREDERSLTTNVLDAFRSPTLALSSEVNTGTDFDPSTITFPDTTQIATAVWNYGKASGVGNKNFRSLSNTAIVNSDGTTSKYIGTLSSSTNTIDAAVWASTDKTLSSADIDDGTTIATTTDIPSIENLTDMLTKIFGVLCHWELDGDSILVKNDAGSTILTIPTTKDKYGDIIRMDGTLEELQ